MSHVNLAITRSVSPEIARCELTFIQPEPLDYALAVEQHGQYCTMLRECGLEVIVLPGDAHYPDCCFIEDTAVVFDEVAILARPGSPARQGEETAVEPALARFRRIEKVNPPATLDGGDVLCIGRSVFIGLSERTNQAGVDSFRRVLAPLGYRVTPVTVTKCLHLKSACTAIDDETILANPDWADLEPLSDFRMLRVPDDEPRAAEVMRVGADVVCLHAGFPRTRDLLESHNVNVRTIDLSEFIKAEAGPTCLSLLLSRSG